VDCLQSCQFSLTVHHLQVLEEHLPSNALILLPFHEKNVNTIYSIRITCERAGFTCGKSESFLVAAVCMGWPWYCCLHLISRGPFWNYFTLIWFFSKRRKRQNISLQSSLDLLELKGVWKLPNAFLIPHFLLTDLRAGKVEDTAVGGVGWDSWELLVAQLAWYVPDGRLDGKANPVLWRQRRGRLRNPEGIWTGPNLTTYVLDILSVLDLWTLCRTNSSRETRSHVNDF